MSAMDTLVAIFPFVPLRAKPNDRSEMVSQVLAGEEITVLENLDGNWIKLRCNHDGYEGYGDLRHFTDYEPSGEDNATMCVSQALTFEGSDSILVYPAGTRITIRAGVVKIAGRTTENFKHSVLFQTIHSLSELAKTFLGVPYLWGGRTFAGIDCSGLTQISAKLCSSKHLPRDASDQAGVGSVVSWEEREVNDLAFFINNKDEVTHVAILLSADEVIHASGSVRIDKLSPDGIIHGESGELTHKLHSIRSLR
jgi:hypothetical protein